MSNIQEYVVNKILNNAEEIQALQEENKKLEKKIKNMKKIFVDKGICFECVCSKCGKKLVANDEHSHNSHEHFPTLCYRCFFSVL